MSNRNSGRKFTAEEDAAIMSARESDLPEDRSLIANRLPGRTAKQCRRHWENFLSPEINSEPWTPEEDLLLLEKINEMGRKWTAMKHFFNGRSAVALEKRWHGCLQYQTEHNGTRFIYTGIRQSHRKPERKRRTREGMAAEQSQRPRRAWPLPFTPEEDAVIMKARWLDSPESWWDIAKRTRRHTAR
jgi:hypothetical protein